MDGSEETHTDIADMAAESRSARPAIVRHMIRDGRAGARQQRAMLATLLTALPMAFTPGKREADVSRAYTLFYW